jgi:hypothetical protein
VWEYPFAVAGVNITFMLVQLLDLEAGLLLFLISNFLFSVFIMSKMNNCVATLPIFMNFFFYHYVNFAEG